VTLFSWPVTAMDLFDADMARTPDERAEPVWYMDLSDVVQVRDFLEAAVYPVTRSVVFGEPHAWVSEVGWPILFGHIICPHGADPGPHRMVIRSDPALRRQVMDTALGAYVCQIMRATGLPDWQ